MYARIASFEGGDFERLRQVTEERMQSGTGGLPEGVKRVLVLVDRESGKRQFVTFFDTREQLEAATERFDQMGDEIPEEIRGKRTSVEVYEVAFDQAS